MFSGVTAMNWWATSPERRSSGSSESKRAAKWRVAPGELADLAVERRREEHRLALAREQPHDAVDLGLEAHVEHAVGLVEDQQRDLCDRDQLAIDQILEPARRGDEHVRLVGLIGLLAERYAAVDGNRADSLRAADELHRLGDLRAELTGGHEHECGDAVAPAVDPFHDRDRERERLAGAGRALRKDVAAAERLGDHGALNRERIQDSLLFEDCADGFRDAERPEFSCGIGVRHHGGGRVVSHVSLLLLSVEIPVPTGGNAISLEGRIAFRANQGSSGPCRYRASGSAASRRSSISRTRCSSWATRRSSSSQSSRVISPSS